MIALPISWLPLVADYNRFARRASGAFWGTALGFFITSSWFLAMGAFLMLGANVKQEPKDFAAAVALIAGWGSLLILLADETHNAWADLYSTAVSLQNVFSKAKQRWLILGLEPPASRRPLYGHNEVPGLPLPLRLLLHSPLRRAGGRLFRRQKAGSGRAGAGRITSRGDANGRPGPSPRGSSGS